MYTPIQYAIMYSEHRVQWLVRKIQRMNINYNHYADHAARRVTKG